MEKINIKIFGTAMQHQIGERPAVFAQSH